MSFLAAPYFSENLTCEGKSPLEESRAGRAEPPAEPNPIGGARSQEEEHRNRHEDHGDLTDEIGTPDPNWSPR